MSYSLNPLARFAALADPTRREIFERVAKRPAAVGVLAHGMPVSRPAVSQHLKVLKEAGLVTETTKGTRHIYCLDPRGIAAMRDWLDETWSDALVAFKDFADRKIDPEPKPEAKKESEK